MEAPGDLPAYVNSTSVYFGMQQKVAFLFSHCTDLQLTLSCGFVLRVGEINLGLMGDSGKSAAVIMTEYNERFCYGYPCATTEISLSNAEPPPDLN